jgi:hypothetical protein
LGSFVVGVGFRVGSLGVGGSSAYSEDVVDECAPWERRTHRHSRTPNISPAIVRIAITIARLSLLEVMALRFRMSTDMISTALGVSGS